MNIMKWKKQGKKRSSGLVIFKKKFTSLILYFMKET